jgi:hypothetical protein
MKLKGSLKNLFILSRREIKEASLLYKINNIIYETF